MSEQEWSQSGDDSSEDAFGGDPEEYRRPGRPGRHTVDDSDSGGGSDNEGDEFGGDPENYQRPRRERRPVRGTTDDAAESENDDEDDQGDEESREEDDEDSSEEDAEEEQGGEDRGEESDDVDEEAGEEQQLMEIRKQLATIPYDELQKIRREVGVKKFDSTFGPALRALHGDAPRPGPAAGRPGDARARALAGLAERKRALGAAKVGGMTRGGDVPGGGVAEGDEGAGKKGKRNHAPLEVSSKVRPPAIRDVVHGVLPKKKKHRDPRFDDMSGDLKMDMFEKSYGFLGKLQDAELGELKKKLKKTKNADMRADLQARIAKVTNFRKTEARKKDRAKIRRDHMREERGLVAETGKRPYYLKKSDVRKLHMVKTYEGLDEKQKDKVLERRRKKKTQKDHRFMPYARREHGDGDE